MNYKIENIRPSKRPFSNTALGTVVFENGNRYEIESFNFVDGFPDETIGNIPCRKLRELVNGEHHWWEIVQYTYNDGKKIRIPPEFEPIVAHYKGRWVKQASEACFMAQTKQGGMIASSLEKAFQRIEDKFAPKINNGIFCPTKNHDDW